MSDRIRILDIVASGTHGALDFERARPQPFEVDVELELPLAPAGRADDLRLTADYGQVYDLVRRTVEGERYALLEALAEAIAGRLLAAFPPAAAVTVAVRKPRVPLPGPGRVEVSITRRRGSGRAT